MVPKGEGFLQSQAYLELKQQILMAIRKVWSVGHEKDRTKPVFGVSVILIDVLNGDIANITRHADGLCSTVGQIKYTIGLWSIIDLNHHRFAIVTVGDAYIAVHRQTAVRCR